MFDLVDKEAVLELLAPSITMLAKHGGVVAIGSERNGPPWLQPLLEAQRLQTLQEVVAEIDQFITDQISAKDTKSAIVTLKVLRVFLVNLAVYQGINLEVGDGNQDSVYS